MTTRQIAHGIAQLGRNGDSTLVHMQPHEVAGLQALAKANGTSLTINPHTGLPEAFSLGGFFSSLLPTIIGGAVSMIPGMQPFGLSALQSGILAGAATGALTNKKNPLLGAAMGGMGGWGGANLASSALKAGIEPATVLTNSAQNPTNLVGQGAGAAETFANEGALFNNPVAGAYTSPIEGQIGSTVTGGGGLNVAPAAQDATTTLTQAPTTFNENLSRAYENVAADPMKFISDNKMPLATTLGGAALSGLEPSDLYGNVAKPSDAGKYDPYATLNLAGNTGLKLYADGGTIQSGGIRDLYGTVDDAATGPNLSKEGYGLGRLQALADGGIAGYAKGGYLDGPGDGMSDSIPATIEGKQPARLADGEFVVPADVVSHLGNGSTKAGSQRLYGMLDKVRKARTGTTKQGKKINPDKLMPA